MTRALRVPGQDESGNAKGVFATLLQGATPKYAINNGFRSDFFRNTLARMFVRVDASEMNTFLGSIADSHTRDNLANRIAGDPTTQQGNAQTGGAATQDASVARRRTVHSNGYLDFLIQSVQMQMQEKVQVSETLSDNYVAYTFGQSPPMWAFQGVLINTVQDDQASNMFRLYSQILRATQMARRQKSMSMSFDSYVVNGVMMNLTMNLTAQNEVMVPFSFQLLVKRVFITNFTRGWVPTTAGTPFSADLNAIAYDGRPREESSMSRIAARTQSESEPGSTPTPQGQADPRTTQASGVANGTADPNFTPSQQGASSPTSTPAPLLSQVSPTPISSTASVVNVSRPETVNASGISANQNVAPGSPASTQSGTPNYQVTSFSNVSVNSPGGTSLSSSSSQTAAEQDVIFSSAGGVRPPTSMNMSGNALPPSIGQPLTQQEYMYRAQQEIAMDRNSRERIGASSNVIQAPAPAPALGPSPSSQLQPADGHQLTTAERMLIAQQQLAYDRYNAANSRAAEARLAAYNNQVRVTAGAASTRGVSLPGGTNPSDPSTSNLELLGVARHSAGTGNASSGGGFSAAISSLFR